MGSIYNFIPNPNLLPRELSHLGGECDKTKSKGIANDYKHFDDLSWSACLLEKQ